MRRLWEGEEEEGEGEEEEEQGEEQEDFGWQIAQCRLI